MGNQNLRKLTKEKVKYCVFPSTYVNISGFCDKRLVVLYYYYFFPLSWPPLNHSRWCLNSQTWNTEEKKRKCRKQDVNLAFWLVEFIELFFAPCRFFIQYFSSLQWNFQIKNMNKKRWMGTHHLSACQIYCSWETINSCRPSSFFSFPHLHPWWWCCE